MKVIKRRLIRTVMTMGLVMGITIAGTGIVWADEVTTAPADSTTTVDVPADAVVVEGEKTQFAVAPSGMLVVDGKIVFVDSSAKVVRVREADGSFQTIAGKEYVSGKKNGAAENATFSEPWDMAAYKKGYAISDSGNNSIRFLKDGKVSNLVTKKLKHPAGLAVGSEGELYIADTGNNRIMVLDKKGKLNVFAGGAAGCKDGSLKKAKFSEPTALYYYKKALYVADSGNHRIVKIADSKVTTIAGSAKGIEGDKTGSTTSARFSNPQGILVKGNVVYIADSGNGSVKKLENGKVTTLLEAFSLKGGRTPSQPRGMVIKGSTLFIGDVFAEDLVSKKL